MFIFLTHGDETHGKEVVRYLTEKNLYFRFITEKVLFVDGNESRLEKFPCVEKVSRRSERYFRSNRYFHEDKTVIKAGKAEIGKIFCPIAGPCAVESYEQTMEIAEKVKEAGAQILRGGAFKPRTSPYTFQGLGEKGLEILVAVKEKVKLPVVSELTAEKYLPLYKNIDILQIGARNMQNFELLKAVGRQEKPVLLKRGMASSVEEWLLAADYILAEGNPNVILCERGTKTPDLTRFELDLSALPRLLEATHLPVIVDPSHASQTAYEVPPKAIDAVKTGADGWMIEVTYDREKALCDKAHGLLPEEYVALAKEAEDILSAREKR